MKKLLLLLALCAISSQISSQDWRPIPNGYKAHFRIDTADVITHSVWVDSVEVVNGDSVFYLNRVIGPCETCPTDPKNCGDQGGLPCNYWMNSQQFLQRRITKRNDSSWYFGGSNPFVLFPEAHLYSSWMFDSTQNIIAAIVSIRRDSVFGEIDSIKRIALTDGNHIEVSKNHGILTFPDFIFLKKYELVGLEGNRLLGEQVPSYWDLFHYEEGDIIHLKVDDYNYGIGDESHSFSRFHYWKTEREGDSIKYHQLYEYKYSWSLPPGPPPSVTYHATQSTYYLHESWAKNKKYYPGQIVPVGYDQYSPIFLKRDSRFGVGVMLGEKDMWDDGQLTLDSISPGLFDFSLNHKSQILMPGMGKVEENRWGFEHGYHKRLIGYRKHGVSVGWLHPMAVDPEVNLLSFSLTPNPTNGIIHLNWETSKPVILTIHNALGQRLDTRRDVLQYAPTGGRQSYMIDLSDRPTGLYFIRLTDGEKSAVKRLVVR